MHVFMSGFYLLHWAMCLFLCWYHTVLITIALKYSLKSGHMMPLPLFFHNDIALDIWGILWFHTNFRIFLYLKNATGNLIGIALSLDWFWWNGHCNNMNYSNPWARDIFPFICVFFNNCHYLCSFQCTGILPSWLNLSLFFLVQL